MENIQVNEEKNLSNVTSESPADRAGMASDALVKAAMMALDAMTANGLGASLAVDNLRAALNTVEKEA